MEPKQGFRFPKLEYALSEHDETKRALYITEAHCDIYPRLEILSDDRETSQGGFLKGHPKKTNRFGTLPLPLTRALAHISQNMACLFEHILVFLWGEGKPSWWL